ncbi:MAG: membrane protein insertion efficiency factor YidD [Planctomycetota bacterium]
MTDDSPIPSNDTSEQGDSSFDADPHRCHSHAEPVDSVSLQDRKSVSDNTTTHSFNRRPLVVRLPSLVLIFFIRIYQRLISPLLGPNCRFTPTCSSYMVEAIEKYGLIVGLLKGIWRICRCHPFGGSGHDPP